MHHIVPKCMGGTNSTENLVRVTARVHFILHLILIRMVESNDARRKLQYALSAFMMGDLRINSRQFEISRKVVSEVMRGRKVSSATRRKLSESKKMMYRCNPESNPFKGKHHTSETRELLSELKKGDRHPFFGKKRPEHSEKMKSVMKNVPKSELHRKNISKSWHQSRNMHTCQHCGIETTKSMNTRWHGDKCKERRV